MKFDFPDPFGPIRTLIAPRVRSSIAAMLLKPRTVMVSSSGIRHPESLHRPRFGLALGRESPGRRTAQAGQPLQLASLGSARAQAPGRTAEPRGALPPEAKASPHPSGVAHSQYPRDELVLELAVAAGCSHLVTYNVRDFAGAERFGVTVIRPSAYLRTIGVYS